MVGSGDHKAGKGRGRRCNGEASDRNRSKPPSLRAMVEPAPWQRWRRSDIFVVMGVSGVGKTTVARALARKLRLAIQGRRRPASGIGHRKDAVRPSAR